MTQGVGREYGGEDSVRSGLFRFAAALGSIVPIEESSDRRDGKFIAILETASIKATTSWSFYSSFWHSTDLAGSGLS